MSEPSHRIRRVTLEVTLPDRSAAWPVQSELGRIHQQSLGAIIDRACTAASAPGRIHRIESLEVDLGTIRLDQLEQELITKLGPQLSAALAAQLRQEQEITGRAGEHPDTVAQVELVAFFAQTGNLPWWADAAPPRVVDETVGWLRQHAAGALVALVRTLAAEPRALQRLVNHCEEARLVELFDLLIATLAPELAGSAAAVERLVRAAGAWLGTARDRYRRVLWLAVLRTVSSSEGAGVAPLRFWREAFPHAARALGMTYGALVTALADRLQAEPAPHHAADAAERATTIAAVLEQLSREIRPESTTAEADQRARTERAATPELLPRFAEVESISARLSQSTVPLKLLFAALGTAAKTRAAELPDRLSPPDSRAEELLASMQALLASLTKFAEHTRLPLPSTPETELLGQQLLRQVTALQWLPPHVLAQSREELRMLQPGRSPAEAHGATPLGDAAAAIRAANTTAEVDQSAPMQRSAVPQLLPILDEVESLLARLSQSAVPLKLLFAALGAAAKTRAAELPDRLSPLDSRAEELLASMQALLASLTQFAEHTRLPLPSTPETELLGQQLLRQVTALQWLPPHVLAQSRDELRRIFPARTPAEPHGATPLGDAAQLSQPTQPAARLAIPDRPPRLDLAYSDTNEVYVENAGLVILWPFLGSLFARLELLEDNQFKDSSARHRAVGLLGYLVTEDAAAPEYQLTLPKVLCGLEQAEVLEFGPPVTAAEAEECAALLGAAIANAVILKEMSVEGFRSTFLWRKGALSVSGGAWLLRVERASYDVVLDRFPWGMSWVKLPWMEAALSVEW